MKFYEKQIGPVTSTRAYAAALRERAKQPNLCSPTFTRKAVSEEQVREAIRNLPDEKLVQLTQVAAQISEIGETSEPTAEEWFLRQLGLT
jgi:hypothetical protein